MSEVYRIDVKIAGTAYVKAASADEALVKVRALANKGFEFEAYDDTISDREFDDPELPEISLSPAMTIYGPFDDDAVPELVVED